MRILHLRAENFKRIQVIDITPKGNVIQITGPNGSGKSSVLDSIMALVGGKAACPSEPIRHGEKKATIIADLGNYIVKRTFAPDGKTTITVETQDGAKFGSAQKLLDEFLGSLSFDPLEFARMKPKDQYETIRQVAGIGSEIDQIDAKIKEEYEERTSWNRHDHLGQDFRRSLVLRCSFRSDVHPSERHATKTLAAFMLNVLCRSMKDWLAASHKPTLRQMIPIVRLANDVITPVKRDPSSLKNRRLLNRHGRSS